MKMPKMKLTDLNKMILPVIIVALIIYLIWRNGKKAGLTVIPDVPYIKDQEIIQSGFNPNILADELFKAMDGLLTASGTKDEAWRKLYELPTDNMVIAVYNAFNQKYGTKGKGSLTQWIEDESWYDYLTGMKSKVLKRLQNLRLQ